MTLLYCSLDEFFTVSCCSSRQAPDQKKVQSTLDNIAFQNQALGLVRLDDFGPLFT